MSLRPRPYQPYKLLTKEEEYALIRSHQSGDKNATVQLLSQFDSFILKTARYHVKTNPALEIEDAAQAARIGFIEGADRFDFSFNGRLSTYALQWMRAKIQDASRHSSPETWISHSGPQGAVYKAIRGAKDLTGPDLERAFHAAAEKTGEDIDYIRDIHAKLTSKKLSLNAELSDEGSTTTWLDRLESPYAHPLETIQHESTKIALNNGIAQLDDRQKAILSARFGLNGQQEQTLEEISRTYSLSKERVRQIEVAALAKLNKVLKNQHLISRDDIPAVTGDLRWGEPQFR